MNFFLQVAEIEAEAFEFDIPMGDRTAREAQGQVPRTAFTALLD